MIDGPLWSTLFEAMLMERRIWSEDAATTPLLVDLGGRHRRRRRELQLVAVERKSNEWASLCQSVSQVSLLRLKESNSRHRSASRHWRTAACRLPWTSSLALFLPTWETQILLLLLKVYFRLKNKTKELRVSKVRLSTYWWRPTPLELDFRPRCNVIQRKSSGKRWSWQNDTIDAYMCQKFFKSRNFCCGRYTLLCLFVCLTDWHQVDDGARMCLTVQWQLKANLTCTHSTA